LQIISLVIIAQARLPAQPLKLRRRQLAGPGRLRFLPLLPAPDPRRWAAAAPFYSAHPLIFRNDACFPEAFLF
jgi:hypothetical protein